jgi:hypothetical protein
MYSDRIFMRLVSSYYDHALTWNSRVPPLVLFHDVCPEELQSNAAKLNMMVNNMAKTGQHCIRELIADEIDGTLSKKRSMIRLDCRGSEKLWKLTEPIVISILRVLNYVLPNVTSKGYSILHSPKNGHTQDPHTDYPNYDRLPTDPSEDAFSLFVTFDQPMKLQVRKHTKQGGFEEITVPPFSALLMRGDVIHAGSEYTFEHNRFFAYLETESHQACEYNKEVVYWNRGPAKQKVSIVHIGQKKP